MTGSVHLILIIRDLTGHWLVIKASSINIQEFKVEETELLKALCPLLCSFLRNSLLISPKLNNKWSEFGCDMVGSFVWLLSFNVFYYLLLITGRLKIELRVCTVWWFFLFVIILMSGCCCTIYLTVFAKLLNVWDIMNKGVNLFCRFRSDEDSMRSKFSPKYLPR